MPCYEWMCPECSHKVERIISNWDDATNIRFRCVDCRCLMDRVQFSKPASPQFKGEGWAADGYAKKGTP